MALAHELEFGFTFRLLLGLVVMVTTARVGGILIERTLRQPAVLGEIMSGILLGPSALGAVFGDVQRFLLPAPVVSTLSSLANLGVILFMFLIGLEFDASALRGKSRAAVLISHASIAAPLGLGLLLAPWLYRHYSEATVDRTVFSLFIGLALSVTAFPVLGCILKSRDLQNTPMGRLTLLSAAVDDVTAWCLLALVSGIATATLWHAARTLAFALLYSAAMATIGRRLMLRFARWAEATPEAGLLQLTVVLCCVLLSSALTELIGIHAIFGAFLLGVILPPNGRLAESLRQQMHDIVTVLLLPLFFACSGLKTELGLLGSVEDWSACAAVCVAATAGKLGGSYVAARVAKIAHFDALAVGALMNTRGLMGIIILNVGLEMGLLTPKPFAMLVVMALVTTFATTPLLDYCLRRSNEAAWKPSAWLTPRLESADE